MPVGDGAGELLEGRTAKRAPIHSVDAPRYFGGGRVYSAPEENAERFVFFSRSALETADLLATELGFFPKVHHTNDWHKALVPQILRELYAPESGRYGGRGSALYHPQPRASGRHLRHGDH